MTASQIIANEINKNKVHIPLSAGLSYHLLSGALTLDGTVSTDGFATKLYTGNGTSQSVVTGVDMSTQWGNSASETFGGLVWIKQRSGTVFNMLADTIRGVNNLVYTNATSMQETVANTVTSFNIDGVSVGNQTSVNVAINTNLATYASWNFQTTHRTSGVTNHGKAYTCHYNPFTGFTIVKYEGSGLAGHEIPHHLGRKLGFWTSKNLSVLVDWVTGYRDDYSLSMNLTSAESANANITDNTDTAIIVGGAGTASNNAGNFIILYGWANSYFDEANTLIGNYEIGIYQGTGVAGNKVTTRGKPAWVMVKRLDSTGNWNMFDNIRGIGSGANPYLQANNSNAEGSADLIDVNSDGFTQTSTNAEINALGGQYLYMVVYDNDSGSGKSKYPRATDTSTLNLNATVPFANGVDANGTKNTILTKNETVSGLTFTQGKNYVYAKNDGTYGVKSVAPQYGSYNGFGDYFDVNTNKWYSNISTTLDTMDATTGWTSASSTLTIDSGKLKITNNGSVFGGAYKALPLTVGKRYRIIVEVTVGTTLSTWSALMRLMDSTNTTIKYTSNQLISSGLLSMDITYSTGDVLLLLNSNTNNGYNWYDNVLAYPINDDGSVDISSATPITESRNYLDAIVYADANGQPTYVEQLPKTMYQDDIQANSLKVLGGFDLGKTLYDVTTQRVNNASYKNESGREKKINILFSTGATATSFVTIYIDGVEFYKLGNNVDTGSVFLTASFDVPNGKNWKFVTTGTITINKVIEVY